jgi:hypothetical protein
LEKGKMSRTREFLSLFLAFVALVSLVAWVNANPPATEQFASISVLGPNNDAVSYFPNNNRIVTLNQPVSWTIQVFNHMGSSQLFQLRIKLANRTITGPDPTSSPPISSDGPVVFNSTRAMLQNETWTIPIQWSVTSKTTGVQMVTIGSMLVNGQTSTTNVPALIVPNGNNFRIVVELWSYDIPTRGFLFSYLSGGVPYGVFDQVWFSAA